MSSCLNIFLTHHEVDDTNSVARVYFGGEIDKEVVADLRPKLSRALDMLEERLARQKFMAGEVIVGPLCNFRVYC